MCASWLAAVLTPTGTAPASGGAGAEIRLAMLPSGENGIGARPFFVSLVPFGRRRFEASSLQGLAGQHKPTHLLTRFSCCKNTQMLYEVWGLGRGPAKQKGLQSFPRACAQVCFWVGLGRGILHYSWVTNTCLHTGLEPNLTCSRHEI